MPTLIQIKQEIDRLSKITQVPKAARFVEGVTNLRGEVIPVLDTRKRFDLEAKPADDRTRIIIVGGTRDSGPSDEILSFYRRTGAVSQLGRLPVPLTHASAALLDGRVIVVGGRRQLDGDQTTAILAIDPGTGRVTEVGHLPQPLSDAAVANSGRQLVVAGGDDGNGAQSAVLALTPER